LLILNVVFLDGNNKYHCWY